MVPVLLNLHDDMKFKFEGVVDSNFEKIVEPVQTSLKLDTVLFLKSQHLNAVSLIVGSPLDNKFTAVLFRTINQFVTGFKITPMKLALANASGLSKGIAEVIASAIRNIKEERISIGNNTIIVKRLNPSFNVAALKALLKISGLSATVNAINELVTHVPKLAP